MTKKMTVKLLAAAIAVGACPNAAMAADFAYFLTGPGANAYVANWQLSSTPAPDSYNIDQGFSLERVDGNFPGATNGAAYFDFFSTDNGGGLSISDADGPALLVSLSGAQLYSGIESAPTMREGVFTLTDSGGTGGYTLRVAAVPEPATWLVMIAGFAMIGGAMRVRRTTTRFA